MMFLFGLLSAYISVQSRSRLSLNKKVDLQGGITESPMMQWALS